MSFRDRPNADEKFLREMLRQQDARREQQVKEAELRTYPHGHGEAGAAVSNIPGRKSNAQRDEQIRQLQGEGFTDAEIAEVVGLRPEGVKSARKRLGLKSEGPRGPKPNEEARRRLLRMLDVGLETRDIAEELGISPDAAATRKSRLLKELAAGHPARGHGGRKFDPTKLDVVAKCSRDGMTDVAIAERLGISPASVSKMRKHLGIAPLEDYRTVLGEVG